MPVAPARPHCGLLPSLRSPVPTCHPTCQTLPRCHPLIWLPFSSHPHGQMMELAAFVATRSHWSAGALLGGDLNAAPNTLEMAVLQVRGTQESGELILKAHCMPQPFTFHRLAAVTVRHASVCCTRTAATAAVACTCGMTCPVPAVTDPPRQSCTNAAWLHAHPSIHGMDPSMGWIHPSVCLPTRSFACLPVHPSACPPAHLPAFLPTCPPAHLQGLLPHLRDTWIVAQPLLMGATANALESTFTSEARQGGAGLGGAGLGWGSSAGPTASAGQWHTWIC